MTDDLKNGFRLGSWRVYPQLNRIERAAESVQLEPKVMDVLTTLIAAGGSPVSRAEMLARLWPGVHVVDDVLTRCIYQLRRALANDAGLIGTVRGRGYRVTANVRAIAFRPAGRERWHAIAAAAVIAIVFSFAWQPDTTLAEASRIMAGDPVLPGETAQLVAVRSLAEERAANIAANRQFLMAEREAVRPGFGGHASHAGTPVAEPAPAFTSSHDRS
ncbi:winged helix-turn-helix domain-containing protein [Hyphobacterium sp.]|uniref:winged helix-turn-helix domain-containing protein n=1 Tax=Hyphobacterium sp. TaxID=2004662 RepID=UPI003BAA582E